MPITTKVIRYGVISPSGSSGGRSYPFECLFGFALSARVGTCPCRKPYPAWQSIENRTMIVRNEGSLQAHWLDGCRSDPVAGNA